MFDTNIFKYEFTVRISFISKAVGVIVTSMNYVYIRRKNDFRLIGTRFR